MLDWNDEAQRKTIKVIMKASKQIFVDPKVEVLRGYLAYANEFPDCVILWFAIQDTAPEKKIYNNTFVSCKIKKATAMGTLITTCLSWGTRMENGKFVEAVKDLKPVDCPMDLLFSKPRQRPRMRILPHKWWKKKPNKEKVK